MNHFEDDYYGNFVNFKSSERDQIQQVIDLVNEDEINKIWIDTAFDMSGNPIPNMIGLYSQDQESKSEFWKIYHQLKK